jgi:hypothetical protein
MPSIRWLRPASQFDEALCLCQSCHAIKAAVMMIAVPKAANNATIIAIIETKVSVIEVHLSSPRADGCLLFGAAPLRGN